MKLILIIPLLTLLMLSGCAQFKKTITVTTTLKDGTKIVTEHTQASLIAERQFEAEKACHESRKFSLPDSPTNEQILAYAVASLAAQNQRPCTGTNHNDVAIAKAKVRWSFAGSLARVLGGAYGVGEIADFGKSLANSRVQNSTTYNTEFGNVSQSNSTVATGGSGEFGAPATTNEGAIRSNSISIGGGSALAGDRAASGETALVNGDSSVISSVEDSDVKGSDTGEDINKPDDQSVFNDDDGGNGVFDL